MTEVRAGSGGDAIVKMALRGLALLCALSVIWTLLFLGRLGRSGIEAMIRTGAMGVTTCIAWAFTLLAGPFAVVQLMRLRNSGRIAAAILFGVLSAHYILGALFFRDPGDPWPPLLLTGLLTGACTALLLAPQAKRAVSHPPRHVAQPLDE